MTVTLENFSATVRRRSAADHQHAETSPFMTAVLEGRVTREQYALLVAQFQCVYSALDTAAAALRTDPSVGPFFDPRLDRTDALAADAEAVGSAGKPITEATQRYADRITEVGDTWPAGLVAHHYTRYLGDLSGGRVIAKRLGANLDITVESGLAFYEFADLGSPATFKDNYRSLLDNLALGTDEQEQFLQEVTAAYAYNNGVFASLEGSL